MKATTPRTWPPSRPRAAKLLELAPNIRLIKDDNLQDDLISGEISAGVMYTSQVTMACLANPDLKVVYPSEGIGFGIMAQFVPVNAPNPDAAHAFIDYICGRRSPSSALSISAITAPTRLRTRSSRTRTSPS